MRSFIRSSFRLGLVALPAGLLACTALLGDFTVSTDAGDSSPTDSMQSDGPLPDVVASDADASDAPVQYKLHCAESGGSRFQVATGLLAQGISIAYLQTDHIRVAMTVLIPFDSGFGFDISLQGYDIDNSKNVTPATLATGGGGSTQALERYTVGSHSGFVMLYEQQDPTNADFLWVSRWPDDQAGWTTPIKLVEISTDGGLYNANLEADIDVIDPTTDTYFVTYSALSGTVQTIYGQQVSITGAPATIPKIASFNNTVARNTFDIAHPGVAFRSSVGYVMLSPSGNNGPPPKGTPAAIASSTGAPVNITPPSSLNYFPIGFVDAVDPATVNTAFLIADLNTLTGNYGIGQAAASSLGTLNPQALPATTPTSADGGTASLKDLMVGGNPVALWQTVPTAGEQFTYAGPTFDPVTASNFGGVNFGWWDAVTGTLRAYQAGDGHLFGDVYVSNTAATITSIVGSVAQGEVAWEQLSGADASANSYPPPYTALWISQIGCFKQ